MAYLVLARKYRPQTFDEVVGQAHVVRTLKNALRKGRLAHALLFSGIRGIGKTTIARILAKAINCESGPTENPCNRCLTCKEITEGRAVDVCEIDAASNRGIDEIRELRENVRFMPSRLRSKVYIIDEAHMLTREAFNALLKTLEEPPGHVYFILATTEVQRIPVTIISRCQRYDFKRLSINEILKHLKYVCQQEGVNIDESALAIIAKEAEGSIRDALSLLDQAISSGIKTKEDLIELFGIADQFLVEELARAIIAQDLSRSFQLLDQAFAQGIDLVYLGQSMAEFFRHLLALKVSPSGTLEDLSEFELSVLRRLSLDVSTETLLLLFQIFLRGAENLRRSPFPKLTLELTVARACEVGKLVALDAILAKLSKLKEGLNSLSVGPSSKENTPSNKDLENKLWEKFVAKIKEDSPSLGAILETGVHSYREEGNTLFLEVTQGGLLLEKEYKTQLLSLGRKLLNREIKISVLPQDSFSPRQKLVENPIVQDVLKILGGRISQIKVYKKEEEIYASQYAESHASGPKDAKKDS